MMTIGILKETICGEKRVILLPEDVKVLTQKFLVVIEKDLAIDIGINDSEYIKFGARLDSLENVWKSDIVFKYKAPTVHEFKYLTKDTKICAIFHAEGNKQLIDELLRKKCTAYTYEFLETSDGLFPMAYPGGEIAGKMAVMYANYFMQTQFGGKGKTLFAVRGASPSKVAIIGYGNVGGAAINLASKLGNDVFVFGSNINKLKKFSVLMDERVKCFESTKENLEKVLPTVDVIIGAILISSFDTKPLITNDIIKKLAPGTIVIDVTCGYGEGYIPAITRKTSLINPVYVNDDGILFCKIDNLPSAYPITTTQAYSKNASSWIYKIAMHALGIEYSYEAEMAKIVENGKILHDVIRQHWEYYEKNNNV